MEKGEHIMSISSTKNEARRKMMFYKHTHTNARHHANTITIAYGYTVSGAYVYFNISKSLYAKRNEFYINWNLPAGFRPATNCCSSSSILDVDLISSDCCTSSSFAIFSLVEKFTFQMTTSFYLWKKKKQKQKI